MLRIGIDLGGTKTEGVVLDASGRELQRERCRTPTAKGYEAILSNVVDLIGRMESAVGQRCRVGIGTPGAISVDNGRLKNSNTTCLIGRPLRDDLEQRLARTIRIANDANCFALSEARDGGGRGAEVVFGVILGTGVGGGIVVRGKLVQGAQHIAGEWGHNVLEMDGPDCYCGKRGCVETFLSGPGFVRDYAAVPGNLTAADVVARAATGDLHARAALERYNDRLARALSVVVNILDPDVIVLGGGMSNVETIYPAVAARLAPLVFAAESETGSSTAANVRTAVVRNAHGDSSGVRGAAFLWEP